MAISRVVKICILLGITASFFVVELAVGYIVGSLALIADAYHMLNDTVSLVIALYAIRLSKRTANRKYTYGWLRAEVLAALVNGIFLLALCFSIFMESIERFANLPEIQYPRLVVIVGAVGLCCNIFGLVLFHEPDHGGHSHGGNSHGDQHAVVREHLEPPRTTGANDVSRRSDSIHSVYGLPAQNRVALNQAAEEMYAWCRTSNDGALDREERGESDPAIDGLPMPSTSHSDSELTPVRHSRELGDLSIHSVYGPPAQNRLSLNQAVQGTYAWSRASDVGTLDGQERGQSDSVTDNPPVPSPSQKLHSDLEPTPTRHPRQPRASSNGALNARAVFIHVLGDALGSLGVVISGLIIWFAKSQARFYADPTLSLVITILIISSAVPLVRSAGFILLQGVPPSISLSDIRTSIAQVDGVESAHELHVWQLSEARLIASVHIKVSSTRPYMDIARDVKSVLHHNGIHSGTVQPEFGDDNSDTKCEITCPPNTCSVKEVCCPLPIKED